MNFSGSKQFKIEKSGRLTKYEGYAHANTVAWTFFASKND